MSRTLEQRIRQLFKVGGPYVDMISADDAAVIESGDVDELESWVCDYKDKASDHGIDRTIWSGLYMLLQANLTHSIPNHVSDAYFAELLVMDDSDPKYLGHLICKARENEAANAMLLGFIKFHTAQSDHGLLRMLDIDVSSFPDDAIDPDQGVSLRDAMSIRTARYPFLVQERLDNFIRGVRTAYPDLSDPEQESAVLALVRDGDSAARMYLSDCAPVLSASGLHYLYPLDGTDDEYDEEQLLGIVHDGNQSAAALLISYAGVTQDTLCQVCPIPNTAENEERLIQCAIRGNAEAETYILKNHKHFDSHHLLEYLFSNTSTIASLSHYARQGYQSALNQLQLIERSGDELRSAEARRAIFDLNRRGFVGDAARQRLTLFKLSEYIDPTTIDDMSRLRYCLYDLGLKIDRDQSVAVFGIEGINSRVAHQITADHLQAFTETHDKPADLPMLQAVSDAYTAQLPMSNYGLPDGVLLDRQLKLDGYVGVRAGFYDAEKKTGHAMMLSFMQIGGRVYMAVADRGVSQPTKKIFLVENPEALDDQAIIAKLYPKTAEGMAYLYEAGADFSDMTNDFGLKELASSDELLMSESVGNILSEDIDDVEPELSGTKDDRDSPIIMSPQKVGNCALARAYRDILMRLTYHELTHNPIYKDKPGPLTLDDFSAAMKVVMPLYKAIKASGRAHSSRLAASIMTTPDFERRYPGFGERTLVGLLAHVHKKRLVDGAHYYGYEKAILQPVLEYLLNKSGEDESEYSGYLDTIKICVGDAAYDGMACEAADVSADTLLRH